MNIKTKQFLMIREIDFLSRLPTFAASEYQIRNVQKLNLKGDKGELQHRTRLKVFYDNKWIEIHFKAQHEKHSTKEKPAYYLEVQWTSAARLIPDKNAKKDIEEAIKIVSYLNNKLNELYTSNQELAIDERMCKYQGRFSFKTYMTAKPVKIGMKFYILADSKSSFVINFRLYTIFSPL